MHFTGISLIQHIFVHFCFSFSLLKAWWGTFYTPVIANDYTWKRKVQMSMFWTLSSLNVETTIIFKNTMLTFVSSSSSCPWWTSFSMLVTWRHGYFWWEFFLFFIILPHWSHLGVCPNPGTLPAGPIPVNIQLHFLPKFLLQYTLGRKYLTFFHKSYS